MQRRSEEENFPEMAARPGVRAAVSAALACLMLAVATGTQAQVAGKRLSDWLLEQPYSASSYPLGLSWRVPEEVPAQSALRLRLLSILAGHEGGLTANAEAVQRISDWVRALPVTGRVPVSLADARWLQANPARDPVLLAGHSVVLPQRPATVTVITQDGRRCLVPHVPDHEVRAYVAACSPSAAVKADWAWLA